MGVPFDALYEPANDYDYEYDYEYDYDDTSTNARKIINTKTHSNTIQYKWPEQNYTSI
jgi:hypothetical protein